MSGRNNEFIHVNVLNMMFLGRISPNLRTIIIIIIFPLLAVSDIGKRGEKEKNQHEVMMDIRYVTK